jgi:hypothetical protein
VSEAVQGLAPDDPRHGTDTGWLNIAFLILAAVLVARFITSGGIPMLHMMGGSPDLAHDHHDHGHSQSHSHDDGGHEQSADHDDMVDRSRDDE